VNRLGRELLNVSLEAQHWWRLGGPVRVAAAVFADAARTSRRLNGAAEIGVDAGAGARMAIAGVSGVFRVDLAKGLADGATAVSILYQP
jgi:hypothetical protein